MGLPLQGGILPQVGSYPKEDCNPSSGGIPPNFGQPPWGALAPKAKGVWALMVLSGNFRNLLESSRTFQDHSRPFRDLLGWFWDVLEPSGLLLEPFGTVLGCSGAIWIGSGLIRVTVNYPNDRESLSVRPAMIRKPFRLLRNHLAHLQSDPGITLISQNNFWCL